MSSKGAIQTPGTQGQNNQSDRSRILVVDDDASVLECVSTILQIYGYGVDMASGGPEAVEKFSRNTYDIILTDFNMPEMDGIQLSARVKERSPRTKVLMMTGRFDAKLKVGTHVSNIDHLLYKPFTASELQAVISECIPSKDDE